MRKISIEKDEVSFHYFTKKQKNKKNKKQKKH